MPILESPQLDVEERLDSHDKTKQDRSYWIYSDLMSGRYAAWRDDGALCLVVFDSETSGRVAEARSKTLSVCNGYYVSEKELVEIADERFEGRYALCDPLTMQKVEFQLH